MKFLTSVSGKVEDTVNRIKSSGEYETVTSKVDEAVTRFRNSGEFTAVTSKINDTVDRIKNSNEYANVDEQMENAISTCEGGYGKGRQQGGPEDQRHHQFHYRKHVRAGRKTFSAEDSSEAAASSEPAEAGAGMPRKREAADSGFTDSQNGEDKKRRQSGGIETDTFTFIKDSMQNIRSFCMESFHT